MKYGRADEIMKTIKKKYSPQDLVMLGLNYSWLAMINKTKGTEKKYGSGSMETMKKKYSPHQDTDGARIEF